MMGEARALFALQPCPALVEEATAPVAHRLAQPHPWPLQVGLPLTTGQNDLGTPLLSYLLPGRDTRPVYVLARLPLETVTS